MEPIQVSAIIFFCIFGGALLGVWLRGILPQHHLDTETKDLIKLGVALIGTMSAMLLGLLVASAKSAYDAQRSELTQMAANTILVDRVLAHYGPETGEARGLLKASVAGMLERIWGENGKDGSASTPQTRNEILFDKIQELVPQNDTQRALKSQVESMAFNLGQMRWLLFEQSGSSISAPFLVVVVFWLSTLFVSFGLFAPRNATAFFTLLISALSVAGALFLILELDHPFSGLIQISSAPLRNALAVLGR
ncbi:MAG: DUF4239 domain-containing protein [Deltaproteobacteria bacterium]|nr:DUF4239 domain-containing protein [Deltaproteobacteria bacterium]